MNFIDTITQSRDSRRIPFEAPVLIAHQPEFLPWLSYFAKAAKGDIFVIADSLQYQKRYFQNKNKIRFKNKFGYLWLTIPVEKASTHIITTSDVKMLKGNWLGQHLRSIRYSYSRAPYFGEIYEELQNLYACAYEEVNLADFLAKIIKYGFKKFDINIPIYRTSEMIKGGHKIIGSKTDWIISLCKNFKAKTLVAGPSGKTYIERRKFEEQNISLVFHTFTHPVYKQIHGDFIPNMSFIDLLFNYGPGSTKILGKTGWELP